MSNSSRKQKRVFNEWCPHTVLGTDCSRLRMSRMWNGRKWRLCECSAINDKWLPHRLRSLHFWLTTLTKCTTNALGLQSQDSPYQLQTFGIAKRWKQTIWNYHASRVRGIFQWAFIIYGRRFPDRISGQLTANSYRIHLLWMRAILLAPSPAVTQRWLRQSVPGRRWVTCSWWIYLKSETMS